MDDITGDERFLLLELHSASLINHIYCWLQCLLLSNGSCGACDVRASINQKS